MVTANGNGAWADFPYYGSDKFWFIEDNTIKGTGIDQSAAGLIASAVEDMWPDIITGKTQRRTATALKVGPCAACVLSRFTTIRFFGQSLLADHSVPAAAFGMITLG